MASTRKNCYTVHVTNWRSVPMVIDKNIPSCMLLCSHYNFITGILALFHQFLSRHPRNWFSASPIFTVYFIGITKSLVTSPAGCSCISPRLDDIHQRAWSPDPGQTPKQRWLPVSVTSRFTTGTEGMQLLGNLDPGVKEKSSLVLVDTGHNDITRPLLMYRCDFTIFC